MHVAWNDSQKHGSCFLASDSMFNFSSLEITCKYCPIVTAQHLTHCPTAAHCVQYLATHCLIDPLPLEGVANQ